MSVRFGKPTFEHPAAFLGWKSRRIGIILIEYAYRTHFRAEIHRGRLAHVVYGFLTGASSVGVLIIERKFVFGSHHDFILCLHSLVEYYLFSLRTRVVENVFQGIDHLGFLISLGRGKKNFRIGFSRTFLEFRRHYFVCVYGYVTDGIVFRVVVGYGNYEIASAFYSHIVPFPGVVKIFLTFGIIGNIFE